MTTKTFEERHVAICCPDSTKICQVFERHHPRFLLWVVETHGDGNACVGVSKSHPLVICLRIVI